MGLDKYLCGIFQSSLRGGLGLYNTNTAGTTALFGVEAVTVEGENEVVEIRRKDYKPTIFDVDNVFLDFDLHETETIVKAELVMHRKEGTEVADLVLHGEDLDCRRVRVDGIDLENVAASGYSIDGDGNLIIPSSFLPTSAGLRFKVFTEVIINPTANLELFGLYNSDNILTTQCEPHGFRRITFYLDRPDVLSLFRVRVEADKEKYPVLLSNGNKVLYGENGCKHFAEFVDPFPKPSYLFALVAGNLKSISTTFKTMSGRDVLVELSSDPEEAHKLYWSLECVLKAMKWDEETYGREYDLDELHIVCIRSFNYGAMENKGLLIFNSTCLLADVETTTDKEFIRMIGIVGHEYFHNWTGNRVTVRDWFQITLKEGLTVFREYEFSGDTSSMLWIRFNNIARLFARQFPEDAGPMAHPIRPESYTAIENFYTSTVYYKGAEVIGMYKTILGKDGFRKGMDLYFERHDGQAVTCDDFRAAMADANGVDLTQFERWYLQAGTPEVEVVEAERRGDVFHLRLRQRTAPTPKQDVKLPLHIPIKLGLIGKNSKKDLIGTVLVELKEEEQTFTFEGVNEDFVLSFNRNFSAPVKVKLDMDDEDLLFLMEHDTDGINRWDASQRMFSKAILNNMENHSMIDESIVFAIKNILSSDLDTFEKAVCIRMPDTQTLVEQLDVYDPQKLFDAQQHVRRSILEACEEVFLKHYESLRADVDTLEKDDMARRELRNTLLGYLVAKGDEKAVELALGHYNASRNMTDRLCAFQHLMNMVFPEKEAIIEDFYVKAKGDPIVIDKWFASQAASNAPDCLERVKALRNHKDFNLAVPNRVRALIDQFALSVHFHDPSGEGYEFFVDVIMTIDRINRTLSAWLAKSVTIYKKLEAGRRSLMLEQVRRLREVEGISTNLLDVLDKALHFSQELGFVPE
ncbi:puromycin-sensitive aminopeptidase [Babesia gibsoni]|uniref:Puromycin-sensitive aminopeptidase n=1 Tax=Babesia gibsoni TaxID=33632 RepID=A0AAD8PCF9_BABGI|nr:puromycin-sensitive aminopeptidase [Babesia gibsoni]